MFKKFAIRTLAVLASLIAVLPAYSEELNVKGVNQEGITVYPVKIPTTADVSDFTVKIPSCENMTVYWERGNSAQATLYPADSDDTTATLIDDNTAIKVFTTNERYGPFTPTKAYVSFVVNTVNASVPSTAKVVCSNFASSGGAPEVLYAGLGGIDETAVNHVTVIDCDDLTCAAPGTGSTSVPFYHNGVAWVVFPGIASVQADVTPTLGGALDAAGFAVNGLAAMEGLGDIDIQIDSNADGTNYLNIFNGAGDGLLIFGEEGSVAFGGDPIHGIMRIAHAVEIDGPNDSTDAGYSGYARLTMGDSGTPGNVGIVQLFNWIDSPISGLTISPDQDLGAANWWLELPPNDGDAGQMLLTDGAGDTSWSFPALSTLSGLGTGNATSLAINSGSAGAPGIITYRGNTSSVDPASLATTACNNTDITVTGVATTDTVLWSFDGPVDGITGFNAASTSGSLNIQVYPVVNNIRVRTCNPTSGTLDGGAFTINYRVIR